MQEVKNLKERGHLGGYRGRKGKGKMYLHYHLKRQMLWVAAAVRGKGSFFTGELNTLQQNPQSKKSLLYLMLLP